MVDKGLGLKIIIKGNKLKCKNNIYPMRYIKAFEAFNPHPEPEPNPLEQTPPDAAEDQKKIKTKEDAQKEEEDAVEKVAAGFISTTSSNS